MFRLYLIIQREYDDDVSSIHIECESVFSEELFDSHACKAFTCLDHYNGKVIAKRFRGLDFRIDCLFEIEIARADSFRILPYDLFLNFNRYFPYDLFFDLYRNFLDYFNRDLDDLFDYLLYRLLNFPYDLYRDFPYDLYWNFDLDCIYVFAFFCDRNFFYDFDRNFLDDFLDYFNWNFPYNFLYYLDRNFLDDFLHYLDRNFLDYDVCTCILLLLKLRIIHTCYCTWIILCFLIERLVVGVRRKKIRFVFILVVSSADYDSNLNQYQTD